MTALADYMKCGISYGIAGLARFPALLPTIMPYLVVLSAFTAFVFCNGGIVLGRYYSLLFIHSIELTSILR